MKPDEKCQKKCANYGHYAISTCQMCLNRSNQKPLYITIDVVEEEWGKVLRELA